MGLRAANICSLFIHILFDFHFLTCNKRVFSRIFSSDIFRDTIIDSAVFLMFDCLPSFFLCYLSVCEGGW